MAATQINQFETYYGNTIPLRITCTRLDGTIPSFTGAEVWVTVKKNVNDPDSAALLQKKLSTGQVVVTDAANGILYCEFGPTDLPLQNLNNVLLVLDVKIREAIGREYTAALGSFLLKYPATRSL